MLLGHQQGSAVGTVARKGHRAPRWGNGPRNLITLSCVFIWMQGARQSQEGNVPGATAIGLGGAKIRAASAHMSLYPLPCLKQANIAFVRWKEVLPIKNQNRYEVPFHTSQNGCDPKVYK